jgi:nucleotide-binding universal stress UspA family protein
MRTSQLPPGCVVAGVDGSEHSDRAVSWAATQADFEGRTLALVHAGEEAAGFPTLARARRRAELAVPGIAVLTEMLDADPRRALIDVSQTAHLVVVGSRGRGALTSALLGSVSVAVARNASCPVVVCRPPDPHAPATATVVVGADGSEADRPALEFAFAQASLRHVPLTVMHCFWEVTVATEGPGPVPADDEDQADLRLLLAESVAGLQEKYPDVAVTQALARGLVDECLADRAPNVDLLVVGRAACRPWARLVYASCALAVVERARAAVAVVPESTRREDNHEHTR